MQGLWHLIEAEFGGELIKGTGADSETFTVAFGEFVTAYGICNETVGWIAFDGGTVVMSGGSETEAGCAGEERDHAMERVFFDALYSTSKAELRSDGVLVLSGEGTRVELERDPGP